MKGKMSLSLNKNTISPEDISQPGNPCVLIVDDDPANIRALEHGLKDSFKICTSTAEFTALNHLESLDHVDVMIINQRTKDFNRFHQVLLSY